MFSGFKITKNLKKDIFSFLGVYIFMQFYTNHNLYAFIFES